MNEKALRKTPEKVLAASLSIIIVSMAFLVSSVPELNVLLPVGLIFQKIAGKVTNAAYCPENSYRGTKIISCVWELCSQVLFEF